MEFLAGSAMPNEELGSVLEMPVSCPHCPKYSMQPVAFIIGSEKFSCPDCKGTIDLTTKEWTAFRKKLAKVFEELQPLYTKLP
jgi:transposase-like protein